MTALPLPPLANRQINTFHTKYQRTNTGGCWEWFGCKNGDGYGSLSLDHRVYKATRIMWYITYNNDPAELCVLHTCDNPSCVNPEHLFLGTQKDNALDRTEKGRTFSAPADQNGNARLTWQNIIEIRESYTCGDYSQEQLAVLHQTTQSHVRRILKNSAWHDPEYVPCVQKPAHIKQPKSVSSDQTGYIKELRNKGLRVVVIAAEMGLSISAIYNALRK